MFYKTKEETRTPTVENESMLLSFIIGDKYNKDVDTCNIIGEFIQANMYEMIHVWLNRSLAVLLSQVDQNKYEENSCKKLLYQSYT